MGRRSFSPNGDGSGDLLAIGWNNRRALDSLTLRVLAPDGTVLGTRPVPATGSGPQELGWDGVAGDAAPPGTALPDGRYLLQLIGTADGATFTWPATAPTAGDLPARTAVVIDRVPPTLQAAKASANRLSPNGDGEHDAMRVSGTGSADVVRWDVVVAPVAGDVAGDPIRRIAGTGRSAAATWKGTADDGTRAADGAYRVTLRLFDAAGNAATRSWPATVDATPPALTVAAAAAAISPDGDGVADTVRLRWTSAEPTRGTLRVLRGTAVIRSWPIDGASGAVDLERPRRRRAHRRRTAATRLPSRPRTRWPTGPRPRSRSSSTARSARCAGIGRPSPRRTATASCRRPPSRSASPVRRA